MVVQPVDVPLPFAYEAAATDRLGAAVLVAAGADPTSIGLGDELPAAVSDALDDLPRQAPSVALSEADQPLAEPTALGLDDWSLVWGARLPSVSVDQLLSTVTGDSYQPVMRGTTACFVAEFRTSTETAASSVLASMSVWAQRAPSGSQAQATLVGPTLVQLQACDPGAAAEVAVDPASVDRLVAHQIDRLTR
jgi:hypothetical protein